MATRGWVRFAPGDYRIEIDEVVYTMKRLPYHRAIWQLSGGGIAPRDFDKKDEAQQWLADYIMGKKEPIGRG
jgi:hypothetical protein